MRVREASCSQHAATAAASSRCKGQARRREKEVWERGGVGVKGGERRQRAGEQGGREVGVVGFCTLGVRRRGREDFEVESLQRAGGEWWDGGNGQGLRAARLGEAESLQGRRGGEDGMEGLGEDAGLRQAEGGERFAGFGPGEVGGQTR